MAGTDWWPVSAGEVVVAGVPYPDESAQQGRGGGLLLVWFLDTCARDYFQQDKSAARRCGNLRIAGRSEESRQALYALRRTSLQRLAVWCFAGTSGGGENGRSSARDGCKLARQPIGGDTEQIKAVGSGECAISISNSYYVARMLRSTATEDRTLMNRVGIVWPNQKTFGAHVNIAGAGVAKYAPNKAAAVQFLEYLSSDSAQRYFAEGNNEWPAVSGIKSGNPALELMGPFKPEVIDVAAVGRNQRKVLELLDKVGYK